MTKTYAAGSHSHRQRGEVDICDFGAVGDGQHDDTAPVRAAVAKAIADNARLRVPAAPYAYRLTSTIDLAPASGSALYLDINGDGYRSKFLWSGAAGQSMFRSRGWKSSRVSGVTLWAGSAAGIVGWDLDVDAARASTGFLTFADCTVEVGTGGACIGWRGGNTTTGPGDVSFLAFHNCLVVGDDRTKGDIGWQALRQNALDWNWFGGAAYGIGKAFSNLRPGGGEAGGASMFFHGFGTSGLSTDFEFVTAGAYSIEGGRFELGQRFLRCGWGGSSFGQVVSVAGAEISSYAPTDGILFYLGTSVLFSLERCWVDDQVGPDYGTSMIYAKNSDAVTGVVSVRDSVLQADEPFYTIGGDVGTWAVRVEGCTRRNTADAGIAGFFGEVG